MFFKKVSYLFLAFSVSSTILPVQQARAGGGGEEALLGVMAVFAGLGVVASSANARGAEAPRDPVKSFRDSPMYGVAYKDFAQVLGSSTKADRLLVDSLGGATQAELIEKYSRGDNDKKVALAKVFDKVTDISHAERKEREAKNGTQVVDETQKGDSHQ